MITKKIQQAINDQINEELYSSYLYLALAAYYETMNLKGFGKWLQVQAREEIGHAMKFYSFLIERGGAVTLQTIKQPPAAFPAAHKAFRLAYEHERHITERIHALYELAKVQKDYAFEQFLHWFIDEQVEEEANTLEIVDILGRIGTHEQAVFMLDAKLGGRTAE